MTNRVFVCLVLLAFCFGFSLMANADTFTTTLPEFTGDTYLDPGPFPTYTIGTFDVHAGTGTIDISGTFGNSVYPDSAGVDLFAGSVDAGFNLVAQCFEYDPCWTGSTPLPFDWSATGTFASDTWTIFASQTSGYTVQLGAITITENVVTPEPSSLMLLGSGLLAGFGIIRRKYRA